MLLVAIILLLVFVSGVKIAGTHSWLVNRDDIGFVVNVADINLAVKQGERQIPNGGNIYLGTQYIEAGATHTLNVTITNLEEEDGFYVRCQVLATSGGETYNINSLVANNLYKANDGWMYITSGADNSTHRKMTSNETVDIINSITFPASLVENNPGANVKLFLYIEGNPTDVFE